MSNLNHQKTAQEIREIIIKTVRSHDGHLSSNLGIVELSIALHQVFHTPEDKIIFDTSHQCYAHKILTDRRHNFPTLRKTQGISGYTSPEESQHDVFFCGHAGTALSSALGMAIARDQLGQNHHIIAVMGDASLTNGLTLEALNHIGKTRIIVILNDNDYSIAKNVGSIAQSLNRETLHCFHENFRRFSRKWIEKIPMGTFFIKLLSRFGRIIRLPLKSSSFFEYWGFKYMGPIDGHNVVELQENLEFCKQQTQPVLLHVKTQKGRGDSRAECYPSETHHVSSLKEIGDDYSAAFGQKVCNLAQHDARIVAITAAMAGGTGLAFFQKQYPHRFFDVGIAEEHMITFAAGLSKAGLLPICTIFSAFLQRVIDNIFHDIALQNLPIIIAIDRAGLSTNDGPTHHGLFDIALLRSIPNLIMMQPKDTIELEGMLEAAVAFRAPCCIRYPSKTKSINIPQSVSNNQKKGLNIQLGQSEILQHGKDICIIALGHKVGAAFEIARKLPQFSFTIVNARFIKPLDETMLINCAQTHRKIYIMEDHVRAGGFGSAVAEFFVQTKIWSQKKLSVDLHIFAWPNTFIPHASNQNDLEAMFHLGVEDMAEKIEKDMAISDTNSIDEECCSPTI